MGYFNFPHTTNYDSDLGWLIHKVKELTEQDESYVNEITSPQNTLLINRVGRQYQLDVKATPEDVNKTYVDNADTLLDNKINGVQDQVTSLKDKNFVDTITSVDGSIGVSKVGNSVDLKFLVAPGGVVTKTYVDEQDKKLDDKINLKLDRNTYIEKMTLLDQMNAYQNEKLEKIEKISEAVVTPDGWNNRTTYYSKDIFVEGIISTDQPVVNVKLSEVFETAMSELEEYSKIFSVISGTGKITLYATEPTTTQITLMLKGV